MSEKQKKKIVTDLDLEAIVSDLKELAKTPKGRSIREAIEQIAPIIDEVFSLGYNHEDICTVLAKRGYDIKLSTLKTYLKEIRRENNSESGANRPQPARKKSETKEKTVNASSNASSSDISDTQPMSPPVSQEGISIGSQETPSEAQPTVHPIDKHEKTVSQRASQAISQAVSSPPSQGEKSGQATAQATTEQSKAGTVTATKNPIAARTAAPGGTAPGERKLPASGSPAARTDKTSEGQRETQRVSTAQSAAPPATTPTSTQ